jgi:NAD(P)-dependent dehydrogenase (short-subunit alcohol dehydrogenase family)
VIVVVGASLAGYAAAARLARVNHDVVVLAGGDPEPAWPGTEPDDVVTLPAAWRDVFTKTGRPLSAMLAVRGLDLVPAPPRTLPDGVELPDDRAGQWHALAGSRAPAVATAWQHLLDEADDQWLLLRRLGVEAPFTGALTREQRRVLRPRHSLAAAAAGLGDPALAGLVTDLATARGSDPRRTPAWLASRLALERTFGRWQLRDGSGTPQPARLLATLLVERCRRRGVGLREGVTVTAVRPGGVETTAGPLAATAVLLTVDPWRAAGLTGRRPPRLSPPTAGARWDGWRTLLAQPLLAQPLLAQPQPRPGPIEASAWSPAGPEPWAQVLTGALAAYELHERLTGEDMRPTNKAWRPPPPRRR